MDLITLPPGTLTKGDYNLRGSDPRVFPSYATPSSLCHIRFLSVDVALITMTYRFIDVSY